MASTVSSEFEEVRLEDMENSGSGEEVDWAASGEPGHLLTMHCTTTYMLYAPRLRKPGVLLQEARMRWWSRSRLRLWARMCLPQGPLRCLAALRSLLCSRSA